ncbi:MAG: single-stranded-DNA-specific exonuclease RecJ [Nevskia sp.]|nr:single-stranded-DNA-specific exonuclease RecJ [Nevskia sp.]
MPPSPLIRRRPAGDPAGLPAGLHPVLRRVYAVRGVTVSGDVSLELRQLLPPAGLAGIQAACKLLAEAIAARRHIVIAGDYDADGATATAVAILGLRALGAAGVGYVVPNRFTMGYGLSPALAEMALAAGAGLLVTVDNGIASLAGVATANRAGLKVLVTDHHLPGGELPAAAAIVNPNQPGCGFASKHLAGVGVMFYVLLALRAHLRDAGWFAARPEPNLAELLDLVALGTVADVVRLDHNNRILVAQGLARIRAGRGRPGVQALLEAAGRPREHAGSADLGFVVGPRLNAAGRLEDMTVGIECLLAPTPETARPIAARLDALNRERRGIEAQMRDEAVQLAAAGTGVGVCLFDAAWHEGVVGLVASRLKEQLHRPVIAFARGSEAGTLKGSGRSIGGLHLRDALAAVDALHPGLILRFGGHAMAAGLTLPEAALPDFSRVFDEECRARLDAAALHQVIETDGELTSEELHIDTARALERAGPWGQGFPEPRFEGEFVIADTRVLGADGRHIKYLLRLPAGGVVEALDFHGSERALAAGGRVRLVYAIGVNRFRGLEALELRIEHLEAVAVGA